MSYTINDISDTKVKPEIEKKLAQGCRIESIKRNAVIVDCGGELEGWEIDPIEPIDLNGSIISIQKVNGDYDNALENAFNDIGGLEKYVKPGMNVAIKTNIASGLEGNLSTQTDPKVVEVIADKVSKICDERGVCAQPYFVEANNIWADINDEFMEKLGFLDLVKREERKGKPNIPFVHLSTGERWDGDEKVPFTDMVKFHFKRPPDFETNLNSFMLDDNTVIFSADRPKMHCFDSISMAQKNMYGAYPESYKSKFHRGDDHNISKVSEIIASAARVMRPILNISDWTNVCSGWNGPIHCIPYDANFVYVSNDMVCADNRGRELAGLSVDETKHLLINMSLAEGNPRCRLGKDSATMQEVTDPDLIKTAPPEWYVQMGRNTMMALSHLSPEVVRNLGLDAVRPAMEFMSVATETPLAKKVMEWLNLRPKKKNILLKHLKSLKHTVNGSKSVDPLLTLDTKSWFS
jgi:uncharacterized protein (DUF362 family)